MWQKIKDALAAVTRNPAAAVKSALTTVVGVGAALALAPTVAARFGVDLSVPADVLAAVTGLAAFLRTLLVALNPKDTSYGVGS